jgi:ubiquitin carboxyl-terminal hydrolase 4/11/15
VCDCYYERIVWFWFDLTTSGIIDSTNLLAYFFHLTKQQTVLYRRAVAREGKSRKTNLSLEDQRKQYILAMDDLQRCLDLLDHEQQGSGDSSAAASAGILKTKKQALAALDRLEHSYNAAAKKGGTRKKKPKQSPPSSNADGDDDEAPSSPSTPVSQHSTTGSSAAPEKETNPSSSSSVSSSPNPAMNGTTTTTKEDPPPPPVSIATNDSSPSKTTTTQPPAPSTQQQKQDVMRLLLARKMVVAKGPNNNTPNGEAFFLIEWKWWCRWCREVDFFYNNNNNNNKGDHQTTSERIQRVLGMLPTGAVVPPSNKDKSKDDDDSSSSEEGDDSSDEALGMIDNSLLFLDPKSIFHLQWYFDRAESSATTRRIEVLRPNLIRGYHYELLPREVYNALRSWYGEVTPTICRRTNSRGIVSLYEQQRSTDNRDKASRSPSSSTTRTPKCCACRASRATARCKRCMAVQYCDRLCQEAHWPFHKVLCKQATANGTKLVFNDALGGKIGLNSLGNTCYMNSALQSLSHATPLVRHFLSNKFKTDLNTTNPLGTGGKLAMAYDGLMKDLWMRTKGSSLSPTVLKRAVAMFAPRFAGCLQHDAQEFLAYLLDGLHEDLNRIRKAPYVTMPDAMDGRNMAIAGAEAWDAHKRRNDSLVFDTFYGQFQSTCICPQCQRVSVSFDAFNHVSLEIPQVQKVTMSVPVVVFRKPSNQPHPPYRYGNTIPRQCCIADLKKAVSRLAGIPATHLVVADIYENTVYELLDDKKSVSTIRSNDFIAAFEVDPHTNSNIHVVATQSLWIVDKDGKEQCPNFGFPIMSSFDSSLTCRQVWDHLWEIVDHLVRQEGSDGDFMDSQKRYRRRDILKIRILNNQGQQVPVFSTEDGTTTSELPCDSDEELRDALGNDCTERFLFLSLEWKNPQAVVNEEAIEGEDAQSSTSDRPILVHPKAFIVFEDHPTLLEAIEKQRERKNGSKAVTLDNCFEAFTKPERLDENNMWYCSSCKGHVRAMKTMKLWRLPNILVVHLKRFEFKHSLRRDKLDTLVDFPLEGLDMSRHCSGLNEIRGDSKEDLVDAEVDATYDLFAVINHYGRMGFGHYTAYCRQWDEESISSQWNLFDDSSVRAVDRSDISGPSAYVLFYRRRQFH